MSKLDDIKEGLLMDMFEEVIKSRLGADYRDFRYSDGQYYDNNIQRLWIVFQDAYKLGGVSQG